MSELLISNIDFTQAMYNHCINIRQTHVASIHWLVVHWFTFISHKPNNIKDMPGGPIEQYT